MSEPTINETDEPVDPIAACLYWQGRWADAAVALTAELGRVERLKAAIRDIDAHATPLGEDSDGFVTAGYVVSVGAIHRALGAVQS